MESDTGVNSVIGLAPAGSQLFNPAEFNAPVTRNPLEFIMRFEPFKEIRKVTLNVSFA